MGLVGPVIQCAANFSEGKVPEVVAAITAAAAEAPGAVVADVSADSDHNRMVLSLLGNPTGLEEAILRAGRVAVEQINLRQHRGVHPRTGAIDVVPFTPLRGIAMEECASLARRVGGALAAELSIPVYLYEEAAGPERIKTLPALRSLLKARLSIAPLPYPPDFGGPLPHPTAGLCIVGARPPLIAFNVLLDSPDLSIARQIASGIRAARETDSSMNGVRALGLSLPSRGLVQVSFNITRIRPGILAQIVHRVREAAADNGIRIAECELIGLAPRASLGEDPARELQIREFKESQLLESWT